MDKWIIFINRIVAGIGRTVSWLSLILIFIIIVDVILRYTLSITSAASFEIEWHLFGALFLLSAGWAFQNDKHVRVDVFYQKFSQKQKAYVNLLGTLILLLPFCYIGVSKSIPFAYTSFQIQETSPDPGGLPARFIIKSMVPAGFFILGLQGISVVLESIKTIIQHD